MTNLRDLKLDLKLFFWRKETRTIVAQISDIKMLSNVSKMPFYIVVFNNDTAQSRVFRYLKTQTDQEDDIEAWHYENISHSLKMTIIND